jgi:hypothetical protein
MVGKQYFNGTGLSPLALNIATDIDAALKALHAELA